MSNEYRLFNGERIELNADTAKALMSTKLMPSNNILDIIKFDNWERFMRDLDDAVKQENMLSRIFSLTYGRTVRELNHPDTYKEDYEPFLHKNYPLVVGGSIIMDKVKVLQILVSDNDTCTMTAGNNDKDTLDLGIKKVVVLNTEDSAKRIKIIEEKSHSFDQISPLHTFCTEEEIALLKKSGLVDYNQDMFELWGATIEETSEEVEAAKDAVDISGDTLDALAEREERLQKSGLEYGTPEYDLAYFDKPHHSALTGTVKFYTIEVDCANLPTGENWAVLFENAFTDEICLGDELTKGGEHLMDYMVESEVVPRIRDEKFKIRTSFALTNIQPDENGKVTLHIINKFIKDLGTDYGWYI